MRVVRLSIHRLRRFQTVEVEPASALNLLTGDNGAGKTSVLEALHLMAYGRSFRGRVRDALIQQGADDLEVFVEWKEGSGAAGERTRRAGLRHSGQQWTGRLDGEDVAQLGTLCAALAVVTFEPGSHVLISGGGEARRRFLDWGLFHVEPNFMPLWRRYARALKQRNALLKQGTQPDMLDVWDHELAECGETLTSRRIGYLERLQDRLIPVANAIAPSLGLSALRLAPGWKRHEVSLADALVLSRDRDRQTGYTSQGPHRADWIPSFDVLPSKDALSRGQAKLTALACLLAQAEDFAVERGEWPVIALDDLGSELDRNHQARVLQRLASATAQVLITATETPAGLVDAGTVFRRFHVEHGLVRLRTSSD